MAEISSQQLLKEYQGVQKVDPHIHEAGHLETAQSVIEYLNNHEVEVGFIIPSALKKGKGSKSETMPAPQRMWVQGWGNSTFGHFVTDSIVRPIAKGMFVEDPDNKGVIASAEEYPDRLMAWVWANPEAEIQKTLDEMDAFLKRPSVAGTKLHFWIFPTQITNPNIMQIAEATGDAGKPLLIDVGVNKKNMAEFDEFAKTHPQIPIIAAHLGSSLPNVLDSARKYDNVYLDMAGYPVTGRNLKEALRTIPADKIIFGSDSPGGISGSIESQLKALHDADVTPRERDLMLTGNITHIVPRAAALLENQKSK